MKTLIASVLVLFFAASSPSAGINLPAEKEIRLENGLTIKVIERKDLPLFSIRMTFKAGSAQDPPGQEGMANLCNEMLMRGTHQRTARQIAEEIAYYGGYLNSFCHREMAGFTGEFLSEHGEAGIEIMADLITNSAFFEEEITKTKNRIIAGLRSQNEDPSTVATVNFMNVLLGDNQFAHQTLGTIDAVGSLGRNDITGFFRKYYTPDNCLLVFCGDINPTVAKSWAEKYLAGWKGKAELTPFETDFRKVSGPEVIIFDKQDATQTQIRIGNIGLPLNHPGYLSFTLARTIYAGGFTSRLMNEIRVNRGLTYGVSLRANHYGPGGVTYVSTFTKNESVGEVLDIILAEAKRMQTEPVPDSELIGNINYRNGLYPLNFETNDDITRIYTNLWFYDLDKSFYEDFQERLRNVTPNDVLQAAVKYFPYENYRAVLVGKADEIKEQVTKFGPVTIKPVSEDQSL